MFAVSELLLVSVLALYVEVAPPTLPLNRYSTSKVSFRNVTLPAENYFVLISTLHLNFVLNVIPYIYTNVFPPSNLGLLSLFICGSVSHSEQHRACQSALWCMGRCNSTDES